MHNIECVISPPEDDQCHWKGLMNEGQQILVSNLNIVTGYFTNLVSLCVTATVLSLKLHNDRYISCLLNCTVSAIARRMVVITYLNTATASGLYDNCDCHCDTRICVTFGTLSSFFSVYELMLLMLLCVARCITVISDVNERDNPRWLNCLVHGFCCNGMYTAMPFFEFGRYKRDFECIHCTYDFIMPQSKQGAFFTIFLLKHVIPVAVMVASLWIAWALEVDRIWGKMLSPTKGVLLACIATVTFCLPIFGIRAFVLMTQLFYSLTPKSIDMEAFWIIGPIVSNLIATLVAIIALALGDKRLVCPIRNLMGRQNVDDEDPEPWPAPAPPAQLK